MEIIDQVNARFWTKGVPVEEAALQQIKNTSSLPILAGPVAVMPDVHFGIGATVGTVIATNAAVIPAAVGVDIGCGMAAVRTNLTASDLPDSLADLRHSIERSIPVGFNEHRDALPGFNPTIGERFDKLRIHGWGAQKSTVGGKMARQCGTLGGGNHFVEICLDEQQRVWIMLHSGSRGTGNQIGRLAIEKAKEVAVERGVELPDKDLAWLDEGTEAFAIYIEAMQWAQDYARHNRDLMLAAVMKDLRHTLQRDVTMDMEAVNCHHNYTNREVHLGKEVWLTRKGAVSARAGELGIIPGSMGVKSYIVRGKGHQDAYCSCSHGAGRKMSRGAAKRAFKVADMETQTLGVECRKDEGVLDEIPGAYKDIDAVMAAQTELVDIVHTLKQVLCVKG
jgi:tRNA-splicing ligase RtcB